MPRARYEARGIERPTQKPHLALSVGPQRWLGLSEEVPCVFQAVFRLAYAATASGIGWLRRA